ncbi:beta-amyrin 11-oxidase-like [Neltuma alba]|uniref:beta-amyrin 11-oxidase-like n=1 Tax=Neltuma alba TaxID=207710 RepID=UPI0010A36CCC|nr:beta-amyrin 11-oxidase-like [Prosopis alba]
MEIFDAVIVGAALILGGYAFVFGFLRRLNDWYYAGRHGLHLPPGDMGWPFLGAMPAFLSSFKSHPDSFLSQLISRHGRTGMYRTYLFGSPSIIVCSPDTCRKVLTDEQHFKLGYPTSTITLAGKRSLHGISNAEHKRIRRLTTSPITGHEALSSYVALIDHIAVRLLDEWSSVNAPIELLSELRKFAFAVITKIFVGSDVDYIDLGLFENLYADLNRGMKSLAINLPGFAFHKALKAREKLTKVLQSLLERKRKSIKGRTKKDMMDMLMEAKDEDGWQLEDEDITDLLLVFLLAGHESSAHAIMWTLIYLTQHPDSFEKAKREQEEITGQRPSSQKGLSLKELKQMEYLSKVIDEMLRRTTISFANFRQAKIDVNINGYTIPKGWKVLVWYRGIHMDPENYVNPEEFDPSRWDNFKGKAGSFIPFGLGSRHCPGSDLAKLEIAIFVHHFLLNYRLERINEECPLVYLPIPRPSDNCLARIVKVE